MLSLSLFCFVDISFISITDSFFWPFNSEALKRWREKNQEQMIRKGYYIKTIRQLYIPGTENVSLVIKNHTLSIIGRIWVANWVRYGN